MFVRTLKVELNRKTFFSKVSGDPFSCKRSADDARTLIYVNPAQHADGYMNKAHSTDVVAESIGSGSAFTHLAIHTAIVGSDSSKDTVEVLWTLEQNGLVRKVVMLANDSESAASAMVPRTVLTLKTGLVSPSSFAIDKAGASVLVGTVDGITRLPSEYCSQQSSCTTCTGLGDPDCGWCEGNSRCTVRAACKNPDAEWKLDLAKQTGAVRYGCAPGLQLTGLRAR
jgi:hypothetical protein